MQTKLTLRLSQDLIEKVKKYSKKNRKSISLIVSGYFHLLVQMHSSNKDERRLTPLVASLKGSLHGQSLSIKDYHSHLENKYL
jgi:hypothetical protein